MSRRLLHTRGEDGATLLIVIGFMVMVGLVSAGLASQLRSSATTRVGLDIARNRQYSADATILTNIAQVRDDIVNHGMAIPPSLGGSSDACGPKVVQTLNNIKVQVDCTYTRPFTLSGFLQRDATFAACPWHSDGTSCKGTGPNPDVIIRAQVNYASKNPPADTSIQVSKTYIQTWSVKQ